MISRILVLHHSLLGTIVIVRMLMQLLSLNRCTKKKNKKINNGSMSCWFIEAYLMLLKIDTVFLDCKRYFAT